ncbi:MAG TPA: N-acetylglucosamine-6-phosphate deacetylase [Chitinophagaceae bacterium]
MQAFYNGQLFDGTRLHGGMAVVINNGFIAAVVTEDTLPPQVERIDLNGHYIAPAFIDLQLYGGNGKLFSHELSVEALEATYAYCLSGGCSQFLITLATNSIELFLKGINVVRDYWKQGGRGLLGVHLEGPYINPLKKGAHIERFIKKPTLKEVKQLLDAGKGVIKMMTLAPEQCDTEIIKLLLDSGVIVSAGHSNATYTEAMEAFNNGIPAATHLFNAMSPLQHRAPGLVGALYDHPAAVSSIVADGIHVDFAVLRISKHIMKERLFLITDAVTATPGGDYPHVFAGDRYTLPDGTLSGSSLTMLKAVKNCVEKAGIPLEEALRMAALYPAILAGQAEAYGRMEPGFKAEMVIFNAALELVDMVV